MQPIMRGSGHHVKYMEHITSRHLTSGKNAAAQRHGAGDGFAGGHANRT
jgi:hypothetical protein